MAFFTISGRNPVEEPFLDLSVTVGTDKRKYFNQGILRFRPGKCFVYKKMKITDFKLAFFGQNMYNNRVKLMWGG